MTAIEEALNGRPPTESKIDKLLAAMPADLQPAALRLLASEHSDQVVAEAFTADGYQLGKESIAAYRRKHQLHRFAPRVQS